MENNISSRFSIQSLTQAAPILRGILASPTGDDDQPYFPALLQVSETRAAVEFTTRPWDPEQPRPSIIESIDRPPLYLDVSGSYDSPASLRMQIADQLDSYVLQHGSKPQAISLRGLGILRVGESEPNSSQPLSNRVALVTGAAGAIGHGICEALLAQGCFVALSDLPGERLDQMAGEFGDIYGERTLSVSLDVTDKQSVIQGFECLVRTWGGVDIVIINAGIALAANLMEMDLEAFQKVERVNVEGTLLTLAEAGKRMSLQGTGGDIVLISSKNVFSPGAKFGAYSATKAGSHQLARIASLEFAEFKIRVNMVSPDAVFSDGEYKSGLWATVGPDRMKARGLDDAGLEEYYRNRNLLKARVTAKHVANAVLFFVTHQTPTTGATIPVDGGLPDSTPR
jgi:NAD(P)-dependent dehydrogenase (short-subunit alcohol dehydrogenase family)